MPRRVLLASDILYQARKIRYYCNGCGEVCWETGHPVVPDSDRVALSPVYHGIMTWPHVRPDIVGGRCPGGLFDPDTDRAP